MPSCGREMLEPQQMWEAQFNPPYTPRGKSIALMGIEWVGNRRVETKEIDLREVYRNPKATMQFMSGTAQRKATVLSIGPWKWISYLGEKKWEERKAKSGSKEPVPKNWWGDLRQPIPVTTPGNGPESHIKSAKTEPLSERKGHLSFDTYSMLHGYRFIFAAMFLNKECEGLYLCSVQSQIREINGKSRGTWSALWMALASSSEVGSLEALSLETSEMKVSPFKFPASLRKHVYFCQKNNQSFPHFPNQILCDREFIQRMGSRNCYRSMYDF